MKQEKFNSTIKIVITSGYKMWDEYYEDSIVYINDIHSNHPSVIVPKICKLREYELKKYLKVHRNSEVIDIFNELNKNLTKDEITNPYYYFNEKAIT